MNTNIAFIHTFWPIKTKTKSFGISYHNHILPPESDAEEVKGLKVLTPNTLLTRPILLEQIKAGNNSYKLKNEIRKILYLL